MNLWLDDIRPMPEGFDYWAKTAQDTIFMIDYGNVEYISFDHDLGCSDGNTGYTVASHIEKLAFLGEIEQIDYDIHSANPEGRKNIQMAMTSAERFWNERINNNE